MAKDINLSVALKVKEIIEGNTLDIPEFAEYYEFDVI